MTTTSLTKISSIKLIKEFLSQNASLYKSFETLRTLTPRPRCTYPRNVIYVHASGIKYQWHSGVMFHVIVFNFELRIDINTFQCQSLVSKDITVYRVVSYPVKKMPGPLVYTEPNPIETKPLNNSVGKIYGPASPGHCDG